MNFIAASCGGLTPYKLDRLLRDNMKGNVGRQVKQEYASLIKHYPSEIDPIKLLH